MHPDGVLCPSCSERVRLRYYFLAIVIFGLVAGLCGLALNAPDWTSKLILVLFFVGVLWLIVHCWPINKHPWSNRAAHADAREASRGFSPPESRAGGRER
jgi:hypothetical protein